MAFVFVLCSLCKFSCWQQPIRWESNARIRIFSTINQGWARSPLLKTDQSNNLLHSYPINKIVIIWPVIEFWFRDMKGEELKYPSNVASNHNKLMALLFEQYNMLLRRYYPPDKIKKMHVLRRSTLASTFWVLGCHCRQCLARISVTSSSAIGLCTG